MLKVVSSIGRGRLEAIQAGLQFLKCSHQLESKFMSARQAGRRSVQRIGGEAKMLRQRVDELSGPGGVISS